MIDTALYYILPKNNEYILYLTKNIPTKSNFISESLSNMINCGIIKKIRNIQDDFSIIVITTDNSLNERKYELDFRFSYDIESRINLCKALEEYNKKITILKDYKRFKIIGNNFFVCKDRNLDWIDLGHIEEVNEINSDIFHIRTKNKVEDYDDFNIDIWKAEEPKDRDYLITKSINNS